ncbi:MAG: PqqD family peptide modification chaperone [Bryobacteraceae bacterium]
MDLSQTILQQNPDLPNAEIDGEVVLMSSQAGRYYSLAGTAAAIWKALHAGTTIGALCASLTAEYAVDEETCRQNVTEFIESLLRHKLIRTAEV